MKIVVYQWEIVEEKEGGYSAIPFAWGGGTCGDTLEELYEMIADATDLMVSYCIAEGEEIPKDTFDNVPENGGYIVTVAAPVTMLSYEGLTIENASKMLQLTPGRVSKIVKDGLLPMYVDPEGRKRIPVEAVKARMKAKPTVGRPKKEQ